MSDSSICPYEKKKNRDGLGAGKKKIIEGLILGWKLINNVYQAYLAVIE